MKTINSEDCEKDECQYFQRTKEGLCYCWLQGFDADPLDEESFNQERLPDMCLEHRVMERMKKML